MEDKTASQIATAATAASSAASAATLLATQAAQSAEKVAVANARMDEKVTNIQTNVREIKDTLKEMQSQYVPRPEFIEVVKLQDKHSTEIAELKTFKDTLTGKMWGIGILAGVGSAVLTLIGTYLVNVLSK